MKVSAIGRCGFVNLDLKAPDMVKFHKFKPAIVDGQPATSYFLLQVDWNNPEPAH